jgi:hypothetical protein
VSAPHSPAGVPDLHSSASDIDDVELLIARIAFRCRRLAERLSYPVPGAREQRQALIMTSRVLESCAPDLRRAADLLVAGADQGNER